MTGKRAPYPFPSPTSHIKKSLQGLSLPKLSSEPHLRSRSSSNSSTPTSECSEIATDDSRSDIVNLHSRAFTESLTFSSCSTSSQSIAISPGSAATVIHSIPVIKEWRQEDEGLEQGSISIASSTNSQLVFANGPTTPIRSLSVASNKNLKSSSISPRLWVRRDISLISETNVMPHSSGRSPTQTFNSSRMQGIEVPSLLTVRCSGTRTPDLLGMEHQTSRVSSRLRECQPLAGTGCGMQQEKLLDVKYEYCTVSMRPAYLKLLTAEGPELERIEAFDMKVETCMTFKALAQFRTLEVCYSFLLTPLLPDSVRAAETLNLRLSVKRATLSKQTEEIASEDTSVILDMICTVSAPELERKPNELTLVLHRNAIQKSLKVYLKARYQLGQEEFTLRPPSLVPLSGSLLSEKIIIRKPGRSLGVEALMSLESISGTISMQFGRDLVLEHGETPPHMTSSPLIDGVLLHFKIPFNRLRNLEEIAITDRVMKSEDDHTGYTFNKESMLTEDTLVKSDIKRQPSCINEGPSEMASMSAHTIDDMTPGVLLADLSPNGKSPSYYPP